MLKENKNSQLQLTRDSHEKWQLEELTPQFQRKVRLEQFKEKQQAHTGKLIKINAQVQIHKQTKNLILPDPELVQKSSQINSKKIFQLLYQSE